MKTHTITLTTLLLALLAGCGDNTSSDNNQTSSSSSSLGVVNNFGNPANTWGYYGDGVYLGDELIVGIWVWLRSPGNVNSSGETYEFHSDGNGSRAGIDFSYINNMKYGVSKDGTQLVVTRSMNGGRSLFTCISFKDGCCYLENNQTLCKEE